ncbi:lysozyme g [Aplysia californica]|uniref:Lysozyme g n=1 Tax=Aplysia californica TaxID=6500 RepID=A0ABM1AC14_APLCA|nr:lysozyme g [Aplysia californica]
MITLLLLVSLAVTTNTDAFFFRSWTRSPPVRSPITRSPFWWTWAPPTFATSRPPFWNLVSSLRTCHGNVMDLSPTGQKSGGVSASNSDAQADITYLNKYKTCFQKVAVSQCIQASLIAALASRESRGGSLLKDGYGDHKKAWGILQCDIKKSGLNCKSCGWDSCCHVEMMVRDILVPNINSVKRKFPSWTDAQALQGGVAAYNFNLDNVRTWSKLDVGTTHDDYSNDVIARAQYLHGQGWN